MVNIKLLYCCLFKFRDAENAKHCFTSTRRETHSNSVILKIKSPLAINYNNVLPDDFL